MRHKLAIFGFVGFIILSSFAMEGCSRSASGKLSVLAWDRNVTVVKKQKRKPYKGGRHQIKSRSHNRVHRVPGR